MLDHTAAPSSVATTSGPPAAVAIAAAAIPAPPKPRGWLPVASPLPGTSYSTLFCAASVHPLRARLACTGCHGCGLVPRAHSAHINRVCFGRRAPSPLRSIAATKLPPNLRKLIASFATLERQLAKSLDASEPSDPAADDQRAFVAQCQSSVNAPDAGDGVSATSLEAAYRRLTGLVSHLNTVDLAARSQPLSNADALEARGASL